MSEQPTTRLISCEVDPPAAAAVPLMRPLPPDPPRPSSPAPGAAAAPLLRALPGPPLPPAPPTPLPPLVSSGGDIMPGLPPRGPKVLGPPIPGSPGNPGRGPRDRPPATTGVLKTNAGESCLQIRNTVVCAILCVSGLECSARRQIPEECFKHGRLHACSVIGSSTKVCCCNRPSEGVAMVMCCHAPGGAISLHSQTFVYLACPLFVQPPPSPPPAPAWWGCGAAWPGCQTAPEPPPGSAQLGRAGWATQCSHEL
jgi:hypothetical protein